MFLVRLENSIAETMFIQRRVPNFLRVVSQRMGPVRTATKRSNKNIATVDNTENPWVEQSDPNGSGMRYYWNRQTNETTPLGYPKPIHWVEVDAPDGSGRTYWWDPETNTTTPVGATKPSIYRDTALMTQAQPSVPTHYDPSQAPYPPQTLGSSMKTYFGLGVGMSLAFAVIGALFR